MYKHPEPDGPGFWVITKYDDVVAVGRDGATYSSDQKRGGVVVLEEQPDMNFEQGGNLMLTMDAPEHTRYRKLVNRGFTPRQINALEDASASRPTGSSTRSSKRAAATSSSTSPPSCRSR